MVKNCRQDMCKAKIYRKKDFYKWSLKNHPDKVPLAKRSQATDKYKYINNCREQDLYCEESKETMTSIQLKHLRKLLTVYRTPTSDVDYLNSGHISVIKSGMASINVIRNMDANKIIKLNKGHNMILNNLFDTSGTYAVSDNGEYKWLIANRRLYNTMLINQIPRPPKTKKPKPSYQKTKDTKKKKKATEKKKKATNKKKKATKCETEEIQTGPRGGKYYIVKSSRRKVYCKNNKFILIRR
jgi:hypothetical protein